MQGELYQALAKVLKRPMRRWWRTTGSWWLVALAVLLVLFAITAPINFTQPQATRPALVMTRGFQFINALNWLIIPVALGLAVICAKTITRQIDQLSQSVPIIKSRTFTALTYLLALVHAWPAAAAITAWVVIMQLASSAHRAGEPDYLAVTAYWIVWRSVFLLMYVVWIVYFSIVPRAATWVPWLLLGGLIGVDRLQSFIMFGFGIFSSMPRYESFGGPWNSIVQLMMPALLYAIVLAYAKNRARLANSLAAILGSILVLADLKFAIGPPFVGRLLQNFSQMVYGLYPLSFSYFFNSEKAFRVGLLGNFWRFDAGTAWAFAASLADVLWIAIHIALIYLITRVAGGKYPEKV